MPIFRIKGIDRITGSKRFSIIDADSKMDAIHMVDFAVSSVISSNQYKRNIYAAVLSSIVLLILIITAIKLIPSVIHSVADSMAPPVVEFGYEPLPSESIPRIDTPSPPPPRELTWRDEDARVTAFLMMNEFVKLNLKSPTTATFELDDNTTRVRRLDQQKYFIAGSVDASNSFGVIVRSDYRGVVQRISEDDWILLDLKIDGR